MTAHGRLFDHPAAVALTGAMVSLALLGASPLLAASATTRAIESPSWITTGFAQFTFYPPHNEYPPNFGLPHEDNVVARYSLAAEVTVEHLVSGFLARLYAFMPMGDSRPQIDYNYDADPICLELRGGLGYRFSRQVEAWVTYDRIVALDGFVSKDEVNPWLSLSVRVTPDEPWSIGSILSLRGFVEGSVYLPSYEYPASPGASPDGRQVTKFPRSQIINARYGIEMGAVLQPKADLLNRLFVFASPHFFFGRATTPHRFDATPTTAILEYGVGIQITRHIDLRITHSEHMNLGGAPDKLEKMMWNGVSLRFSW
jgi:hypothetical protein